MEQKTVKFEIGKVLAIVITVVVIAGLAGAFLTSDYYKGMIGGGIEKLESVNVERVDVISQEVESIEADLDVLMTLKPAENFLPKLNLIEQELDALIQFMDEFEEGEFDQKGFDAQLLLLQSRVDSLYFETPGTIRAEIEAIKGQVDLMQIKYSY